MTRIQRLTAIAAVAATALAGACKDSTAPSAADPSAMATTVTSLNSNFSQNAVFQSLMALSGTGVLAAPVVLPQLVPPAPGASRAAQRDLLLRVAARAPTATLALFKQNTLGKTFQWDTASGGHYRISDSSLAGAPAAGIRFTLYQVDTATNRPRLPLTTTGYVDLTDVSNVQSNGIHLLLRVGQQTAADYTVTEVKTTSSMSLAATGYVQDVVTSGPQVSFNLSHTLTLADSSLSTNYQASASGATVTMQTSYVGSAGNESESLDWMLQKNGSIEVAGLNTPDSANFQFKLNGTSFATVRQVGNSQETVTGPGGRSLTAGEILSLVTIIEQFAEVYGNLSVVFLPTLLFFV
jgi:hypothetical protein